MAVAENAYTYKVLGKDKRKKQRLLVVQVNVILRPRFIIPFYQELTCSHRLSPIYELIVKEDFYTHPAYLGPPETSLSLSMVLHSML